MRFVESHRSQELPKPWVALGRGFDLIGDGSLLAVPLPGHAAGHMGVVARDEQGRQLLLAADSSWSLRAIRECRLPSVIARPMTHDWAAYRATLGELHRLSVGHPELVILPSHCENSLSAYQADWTFQ
jgi:glyoxylase-like metal-dependent hydrolase (beta-lactamase superfamily II)